MTMQQYSGTPSVIVVGGGLGGSAAAAFLAHAGIDVTLLERHRERQARPRAWAVSARTMELLRELRLAADVRAAGTPGSWDMQTVPTLLDADPDHVIGDIAADVSPEGSALCDQDLIEALLQRSATAHGADLRFGRQVTGVVEHGDHVEVHNADGTSARATYVVLAEGAQATLATGLGAYPTAGATRRFASFDQVLFRCAALDDLMAGRAGKAFLCTDSRTIVFRRDEHRWQVQRQDEPFDDVPGAIAAAVGRSLDDIEVIDHGGWQPSAASADVLRMGRVFVVGDAAHTMPPSLGMGGNLAVADAHNLAWKLAWVLTHRAGERLLESYAPERGTVGRVVVDESVRYMTGERTLDNLAVQLGLGYPTAPTAALLGDSPDVSAPDGHRLLPVVGARLPHVWLPDGRSSLDLVGVDTFAAVSGHTDVDGAVHVPGLEDAGRPEHVWLVRPDGHVAAHVPADDLDDVRAALVR